MTAITTKCHVHARPARKGQEIFKIPGKSDLSANFEKVRKSVTNGRQNETFPLIYALSN